ncbi:MAG TPA: RnfABCDGE type electron transport complex subunit D [Treponemataceae bacterium]|nr:RnfABCDGE type electron transport complex subunit D [Treponemataceae bacterium]
MAPSDRNEIYISSSPHITSRLTTQRVMIAVIFCLLPLVIASVFIFGLSTLYISIVCVLSCIVFEALFQKISKKPILINNLSAIVTGLILACVLPPNIPLWQTILGAFFAIIVGKEFFGGIGSNVFNPALIGRAFMVVSFPASMGSSWIAPGTDAISGATMLSQIKTGTATAATSDTYIQFLLGNRVGCIGETSTALILLACVVLVLLKIIDWRAPLAMLLTVAVGTYIAGGDVILALLSGGLLFGAVFMVTDYATTPVTKKGRLLFGFGAGLITFLIRQFGGYPEGVMFSILIMNAVTPFLNNLINRKFGYKTDNKTPIHQKKGEQKDVQ